MQPGLCYSAVDSRQAAAAREADQRSWQRMGAIGRWPGRRSGGRSQEDGIVNIFDRPVILSRRSPRATWGDLNARAPLTFLLLITAGGGRPIVEDDGGEPMLAS
jgi:hypothetical protein